MPNDTDSARAERVALIAAALRGFAAGIARAIMSWLLTQIHV